MSKKDFKEFVDFVTEQFSKVIEKLNRLEESKADKNDVYRIVDEVVDRRMEVVEERMEKRMEEHTGRLLGAMDEHAKALTDQKQEQDMLKGQVNRHDKWINRIALKTDTQLDY